MTEPRLIVNRAKCLKCGDVIQSKHQHDFVSCTCGNLSVDGGISYARRVHKTPDWQDMCLYEDDSFAEIRKYILRGSRGVDGRQPLTWIALVDMSDSHLEAVIDYKQVLGENDIYLDMYRKEVEYRAKCKEV